ncbi:hypothetical protein GH714_014690 [Hevea brasiliensis]|uniref:Uncharacterized protein n=1 Tax=Hevea brasiliensis TaxID=3981 RepID=A0A6A6KW19_HEVBR|nr:hypothetical protein GH714_014690 [Hevea brasiliensis]
MLLPSLQHFDLMVDGKSSIASRQQIIMEKGGDMLQDVAGVAPRFEEKIHRLPAGGEGWDTKNKKKRSVGLVGIQVSKCEMYLLSYTLAKYLRAQFKY